MGKWCMVYLLKWGLVKLVKVGLGYEVKTVHNAPCPKTFMFKQYTISFNS